MSDIDIPYRALPLTVFWSVGVTRWAVKQDNGSLTRTSVGKGRFAAWDMSRVWTILLGLFDGAYRSVLKQIKQRVVTYCCAIKDKGKRKQLSAAVIIRLFPTDIGAKTSPNSRDLLNDVALTNVYRYKFDNKDIQGA